MSSKGQREPDETDGFGKLSIVGVSALDERLYRDLLGVPGSTLAELALRTEVSVPQARQSLARLERVGLLSRRTGNPVRFIPAPPDVAVNSLIAQRQDELERARLAADGLLADFHRGIRYEHTSQVIELISGPEAINQRAVQLMRGAAHEVMMFDKPPYVGSQDNPDELELLARGVRWRAVYSTESMGEPGQLASMTRFRDAGEHARLSSNVPTKLVIVDHRLALLPLTIDEPQTEETAILVHPCSLLSMLIMHFETIWERSIPFDQYTEGRKPGGRSSSLSDRQILQLLSAGLKDEAIARQLGISLRTARRWISHVMADRGVSTRFQLGLIVARELTGD
jgi:sugar-specific transcriptional regulator TrmB/DNA-binding CsgD family transcriptional regulator